MSFAASFSPRLVSRRLWLRGAAVGALAVATQARAGAGDGAAVLSPGARRPIKLAVGGKTALCNLPLALAEELGFFRAEGLDVELQDHAGDSLARAALTQGDADVAAGGFAQPLLVRRAGRNCLSFAMMTRAPQVVFGVGTRAFPDFRHVAQLRGRRVGITAQGATAHGFARRVLARGGVGEGEVEFVPLGTTTAAATALREGRVDALANLDPVISQLEHRAEIRLLADTRSLRGTQEVYGGEMPGVCLYAPQALVLREPQIVQALTNAVVRALRWLQTAGPSDIARALPEAYMHGDRGIYLAALEKCRAALSPDGTIGDGAVARAYRALEEAEGASAITARPLSLAAVYTNEFALKARPRGRLVGPGANLARG